MLSKNGMHTRQNYYSSESSEEKYSEKYAYARPPGKLQDKSSSGSEDDYYKQKKAHNRMMMRQQQQGEKGSFYSSGHSSSNSSKSPQQQQQQHMWKDHRHHGATTKMGGATTNHGGAGAYSEKRTVMVEIQPGFSLPLRGSEETMHAVELGIVHKTACMSCCAPVVVMEDCIFVICPKCKSIGPVEGADDLSSMNGFVGLGLSQAVYDSRK